MSDLSVVGPHTLWWPTFSSGAKNLNLGPSVCVTSTSPQSHLLSPAATLHGMFVMPHIDTAERPESK